MPSEGPAEIRFSGKSGEKFDEGVALCMSGGGYRAMLFHAGSLWRLADAGILPSIKRISSVSGGSITAGVLAIRWSRLIFDEQGKANNFESEILQPIRELATKTIDLKAICQGLFWPGGIGSRIADAYDRHLFGGKTLQDLPDHPRFTFNATSLQTGTLWRFSKDYMADYQVGLIPHPSIAIASVVAASSAFPPFLSPVRIQVDPTQFEAGSEGPLFSDPFNRTLVLTDGGVYDNLGLESVIKRFRTILVSDGGGKMTPQGKPFFDWPRHVLRVLDVVDNQVRSLRKRQLFQSFGIGKRDPSSPDGRRGAYWGIRMNVNEFGLPDSLACPFEVTTNLANTPTRLAKLDDKLQERLINWGYASADAAIRSGLVSNLPRPNRFPYDSGI